VYDVEFVHAETGQTIGTASRERFSPPGQGSHVTLEHAIHGPLRYVVTSPPDHWYAARSGRLAKADQYAGARVRLYIRPVPEAGR
jgi:hypothetical protein